MEKKEYRCTRNALYQHDCIGRDDLVPRQGYYIRANCAEEAWEEMAKRYPDETEAGFTVQEWESVDNVVVLRVEEDENGNEILINQDGKIAITDEKGNVIGYEQDRE
ncbi:MAG: hypothetical protein QNJ54_06945 [Prochloraceae cyanobacterium]|nr:hypothetical protein [Prochloraceae cyanobacterium]